MRSLIRCVFTLVSVFLLSMTTVFAAQPQYYMQKTDVWTHSIREMFSLNFV